MITEKAESTLSKSDFIRSLPTTMPVAEVLAKAEDRGLTLRPHLVYEVRRNARIKKGRKSKAAPNQTQKGTNGSSMSIADFVRAHADLSPRAIVAKAHAEGMKLNVSYVYAIRKGENKKKAATTGTARTSPRAAESVPRSVPSASKAEDLLKAVAAEVGLGRAIDVLEKERARVRAMMGR